MTMVITRETSRYSLQTNGPASTSSHDSSPERIHNQSSELILFFLDVANSRAHSGFLGLAKDLANQVTCEWHDFPCDEHMLSANASLSIELSNIAFALSEMWKVTRDPLYRDTGLEIIRYLGEIDPQYMDNVNQEGRQ